MDKTRLAKKACFAFLLGTAAAIASLAQTFTTLVNFDVNNGEDPMLMSLVQGADGYLYGTTSFGGDVYKRQNMPLESYKVGNRTVKLGKHAARHDARTLQFSNYLKATAPPAPPKTEDWTTKVKQWPMMLNDTLGDCTCACAGHMIEEWTTYAHAPGYIPTDPQILQAYEAVGGYKPGDPSTDKGAAILDVLNYWRQTGIAGHPITAFVSLEPKNREQVKDAVYLLSLIHI